MSFDFSAGRLYAFRQSTDFKHWLFVSAGSDNVGVSLVLNALDCSSLRSNNKPNDTVGHTDLDCDVSRDVSWRSWWSAGS